MTTQIGASVFVDPSEIRHNVTDSGGGVLTFGPYPTVRRLDLYLDDTAGVDAVIAELVALKQEMDPPVVSGCAEMDDGYICNGHDSRAHHVAYGTNGEVCHRWPAVVVAEHCSGCGAVTGHEDGCEFMPAAPVPWSAVITDTETVSVAS